MVLGVLTDVAKIRFCVDFSERERERGGQTDRQTERGGVILNVADGENNDV